MTAFQARVRLAMDRVCPAAGRVPLDILATAVWRELRGAPRNRRKLKDPRLDAALLQVALRNAWIHREFPEATA